KSPATGQAPSGSQCENCHNVTEYRVFCARIAFCCPGAFSYLWGRNIGSTWPEPCPRCRSPPPRSDFPAKIGTEQRQMEVTSYYNGQAVAVEATLEVYEFLDRAHDEAEILPHEQRRHWDGREFDEYIVATEGVGIYGETPEDYLCRKETLGELMAVLDTCTEAQRCRFLLYALDGM